MKKLSPFEAYIALIKGYCILSALFLPKAFVNGGWGISLIFLTASGVLSLIACFKLVDAGLALKIYSYPLVVQRVLGKRARLVIEVIIALTQYSFVISHITFLIASCKTTVDSLFSTESNVAYYCITICVICTFLSWVRNLAKFSFTFLLGNILVLITICYVLGYAINLIRQNHGVVPGAAFLNPSGYISTLGITIYCYEGIGIVMPVMAASEQPERFKEMLTYAVLTLIVVYSIFSEVSYMAWGDTLDEPLVTEMLPADNVSVILIKFLYSLNLICSFPIAIQPTFTAVEAWFCGCLCLRERQTCLYWVQNFSRFLVCISAIVIATCLADKIDKFLGLIGSFLCAPLALFFPALVHLNLIAKSRSEKIYDLVFIFISICIFFFCTVQSMLTWNVEAVAH